MNATNTCTISLGSNSPDKESQIKKAVDHICEYLKNCSISSVYETEAINGKDDAYLNAVIIGSTNADYESVNKYLKDWEAECGRTKSDSQNGVVVIDLDLVIWDEHIKRPKDFERLYFNQGYRELLASGAYETL